MQQACQPPHSERLADIGSEPSFGRVGSSYDNALAETLIGLFNTEIIRARGPWRHLEAVEFATLDWVHWFNHQRLFGPIGDIPPVEAEANFYETLAESAEASRSGQHSQSQTRDSKGAASR